MSKELTEQWRNGTLKFGYYYVKNRDGEVFTLAISGGFIDENLFQHIVEVFAPVPTYDQFVELTEKVEDLEQDNKCLKSGIDTYESQLSRISEQLKEAEEALKDFCDDCTLLKCGCCDEDCAGWKARQYLKRYGKR